MSQLYWVVASETHLVRTNPYGDGYEVISGHRRKEAAVWAGETKVPVVVRELDDDQAVVAMVDSNLHRENLKPSEKAFALEDYDHWIAFGLLAFLGGRMIKESFSNEDKRCFDPTKLKVVVTLAIATSIDALAIGISFAFVGINSFTSILSPIVIIGFTSFVISTLGSLIGVFCGKRFNLRMELWGGLVLIIIGVKILIEHLFLS